METLIIIIFVLFLVLMVIGLGSWAYELYQKTKESSSILVFYFIRLPLILIALAAILAVIVTPFYFFGVVDGMVILACAVVIISKLMPWNSSNKKELMELQYALQTHSDNITRLRVAQEKGLQTILDRTEELEDQLSAFDIRIIDIEEYFKPSDY